MFIIKKFFFNRINLINFLISLIPLSLILGNLITNINIILICFLGIFIYKKEIFNLQSKFEFYLVCIFFSYLIIITLISNSSYLNDNELYKSHIIKSLFYLRFLILFLVIYKLVENKDFDTKIFFISCSFFSLIVSIDIIIQYSFGKNILGFPITAARPSSFFNEENIAGGFLQKFSLFLIFFLALKKKNNIKINNYILILSILLFFPILFTSNKMPVVIYLSSILLFFLIERKFIKIFFAIIMFAGTLMILIQFPVNDKLNKNINFLLSETFIILKKAPKLFIYNNEEPIKIWRSGYLIHFNTGIQIWKENKIFGNGLKSFRLKCSYENNQTCNTHPHNYFIELMVDTGIIGILMIYFIIIKGLKNFIKHYYHEKNLNFKLTAVAFFLIIFFEFFPIRSTGSFFTTNNSAVIFLILPIFLNFKNLKKL